MTGIFNKKPPQPRCPFVWDMETVLNFLRYLPETDQLSDKLLTFKTTIFLALLSASQVSKSTNLQRLFNQIFKSLNLFVSHLTKTCRSDRKPHPNFKFFSFPKEFYLYLLVCNSLVFLRMKNFQFVCFKKQHKPVYLVPRWLNNW